MPRRDRVIQGFTLVETMVAGTIMLSMSLICTLWLTGVSDVWNTTATQSEVRTTTQHATNRMVAELMSGTRTAAGSPPNATIPAAPNNTSITFYLPEDSADANTTIIDDLGNIEWGMVTPVVYSYNVGQQQLIRTQGAQQTVLAEDVTAVTFEDATIDATLPLNEIKITLTTQRTTPQQRAVSATVVETVRLRN